MWTKKIPVIIVTELNTQLYWEESYREGATGYIVKNLHFSRLAKKIRENIAIEEPLTPYRKAVTPNYLSRKKTKVLN
jgi:DNA-binding NarL/FixJ family response regulator